MTPAEAIALITQAGPICKAHGISRIKIGELELEFQASQPVDEKLLGKFYDKFMGSMPTDSEVLFHSAPGELEPPPPEPPLPQTARGRNKMQFTPTDKPRRNGQ